MLVYMSPLHDSRYTPLQVLLARLKRPQVLGGGRLAMSRSIVGAGLAPSGQRSSTVVTLDELVGRMFRYIPKSAPVGRPSAAIGSSISSCQPKWVMGSLL